MPKGHTFVKDNEKRFSIFLGGSYESIKSIHSVKKVILRRGSKWGAIGAIAQPSLTSRYTLGKMALNPTLHLEK